MKHLKVHEKYSTVCRIFNSLLCVSSGDETLDLMLDILQSQITDVGVQRRKHFQNYYIVILNFVMTAWYKGNVNGNESSIATILE